MHLIDTARRPPRFGKTIENLETVEGFQECIYFEWEPAVPPLRTGFQIGLLPAASGSFVTNDHNGDVTVEGLGFVDYSLETGTAGISLA